MAHERELAAALAAADDAGRLILEHYAARTALADAPATISTPTDRAAQDAILSVLAARFPSDAFRAEEKTPLLETLSKSGSRMWIIDPIDGTRGFAKKNGEFSVMIALAEEGRVTVGVVLEPAKRRLIWATHGGGCWRRDNGETARVQVSATRDLDRLTLVQSHTNPKRGDSAAVRRLHPERVIETYSAGVKLAQVARGEADLYVCEYDVMNDWDIAAGEILVEEAGGRVTTAAGEALIFGQPDPRHPGGLLASNGRVHEAAIARLKVTTAP